MHLNVLLFLFSNFDSYCCLSNTQTEHGKNECKALETAAFIGNAGEMYFARLSTQKSNDTNICRKSRKVENIATSNLVATYLRPQHLIKGNVDIKKREKSSSNSWRD